MKKVVFVLIGILCTINVFARIPSVQEAQQHASASWLLTSMMQDKQKEAKREGSYDRYYVRLTHVPSAAVKEYITVGTAEYAKLINWDAYLLDYYIQYNGDLKKIMWDTSLKEYDLERAYSNMISYYVQTHTGVDQSRTVYKYEFVYTAYKYDAVTGETYSLWESSSDVYYDPVRDRFIRSSSLDASLPARNESIQKTADYIASTYTFDEFISLTGVKKAVQQVIDNERRQYGSVTRPRSPEFYKPSSADPKEKLNLRAYERNEIICETIKQSLQSAGPILTPNSSAMDKYNKAMFGDISAQIKNMPSSSIKSPSYPGGDQAIASYVQRNLKYPESLNRDGISESMTYTLTVGTNGAVKSVSAESYRMNSELKSQTIQLLKSLPQKFTPASGFGQNVEAEYRVEIDYHLDPILTIDEPSLYFQAEGGEKVVRVTTKKEWTYSAPQQSGVKARKEGNQLIITCDQRKKQDYDPLDDKVYVSVVGKNFKYEVSVRQDGAPKPYIRPSQTKVYLPSNKKVARAVVTVDSNREWKVIHHNPETKIDAHKVDNRIVFTAPTNSKKYGKDATITLNSLDNDCQTNILVHQYSKKEEKGQGLDSNGRERSSRNSGLGLWYNYYDKYGSFELGLLSVQAGFGCTLPLFADDAGMKTLVTQPYFPMNFELGTLRFHFIELSLLNLRLDLSLDGLDGIAWEPQVRALFPVSDRWALMPYVGPVWQIDTQQMENSVWSASGGLIARVRYGHATHTDLSIGYRGGPLGGIAIGVSIGWSLGW